MSSLPEQIVLVGLPGSGKTTVAELLAKRLGWSWLDFDAVIAQQFGMPITRVFEQMGEDAFREVERRLTEGLASSRNIVLSPGGGWILRNDMPDALMVWLQVDAAEAIQRMGDAVQRRPLLAGNPLENMQELYAERATYYQRAAVHIDTNGKTADVIVDEIVVALERHGNQEK